MRRLISWGLLLFVCGCGSGAETPESAGSPQPTGKSSQQVAREDSSQSSEKIALTENVADPSIRADLDRAAVAMKKGEVSRALEILSQVIGKDPECSEAYIMRAQLHAGTGMDANAIADFATAIRLAPLNAHHYNARGFFLLNRRHTTSAMQDFKAATKLDPNYAEPYNNRGLLLLATGKVEEAIAELNKAIELNPKYIDAFNNRGAAHLQADRVKDALSDLDAALAIDADSSKSYYNRGLIHYRAQNFEKALGDFTNAIVREPNNPTLYENRRRTYVKLKLFAEAQSDAAQVRKLFQLLSLNKQIFRQPRNAELYVARGNYFAEDNNDETALLNFDRALQLNPKLVSASLSRARLWLRKGDADRAIQDCNRALRINPSYEAFSIRGDAYLKAGDYPSAIADFERCKRFDDAVAEAYQKHGEALLQLAGHEEEGKQAVEHALAIRRSFEAKASAKPAELPTEAQNSEKLEPVPSSGESSPSEPPKKGEATTEPQPTESPKADDETATDRKEVVPAVNETPSAESGEAAAPASSEK